MKLKFSPFHIRYVKPQHVEELFFIIASTDISPTDDMIMTEAKLRNYELANLKNPAEQFSILRSLGIVEKKGRLLTEKGKQLYETVISKQNLLYELFHFLFYTTWNSATPAGKCFSWSYRQICTILWNSISSSIVKDSIASQLKSLISLTFPNATPSVGVDTVRATLNWQSMLTPPCISDDNSTFNRRSFCPPELLLLAIDFVYRENGVPYNSNLLMSDEVRDDICRVCLLAPESFDKVLSWTLAQFDFLGKGVGGGWGSYLLLNREPELTDLV